MASPGHPQVCQHDLPGLRGIIMPRSSCYASESLPPFSVSPNVSQLLVTLGFSYHEDVPPNISSQRYRMCAVKQKKGSVRVEKGRALYIPLMITFPMFLFCSMYSCACAISVQSKTLSMTGLSTPESKSSAVYAEKSATSFAL